MFQWENEERGHTTSENLKCLCCVNGVNVRGHAADFHTMQATVSLLIIHSTDDMKKRKKLLCEQTVQHNTSPNNNHPN